MLAVVGLFAAAVAVVLGPSLAGLRVALPHDLHMQNLPWSALPDAPEETHNGELFDVIGRYPLQHALVDRLGPGGDASWLPDFSFGFPGWEFIGWATVSPFTLVPALLAPFDLAWSWGQGLRLLAAMGGAYLLTRALGAGRAGGATAGVAFGLSWFVVGWLGWPQSHVAAAMPWVWWAVERTAGPRPRWWGAAALAVATLALWLGGFPALSVYALISAGIVAFAAAARTDLPVRRLAAAAAGVGVGTALAAFTLLPSLLLLEEVDLSARADAWRSRVSTRTLWTFVSPHVFGGAPTDVPRWIGPAAVETTAYVGVVTLALAVAAWALGPRRRGVVLHTGMAFGFGALAYGVEPLVSLIRLVPPLATNPPNRVLALVCLSAATVGGLGVDAVRRWLDGRAWVRPAGLVGAVAVAAAFAAWGVERVAAGSLASYAHDRFDTAAEVAAARSVAATSLAVAAGLLALTAATIAAGWLASRRRERAGPPTAGGRRAGQAVAVALALLVATDVTWHALGWNTQVPRDGLFPEAAGLADLRAADGRVSSSGRAGNPNSHFEYGYDELRARVFLTADQRAVLDRAGTDVSSPTRWRFDDDARDAWSPWASVLGVHAMLTPAGGEVPDGWQRRQHGSVDVLVNPHARPPVVALTDIDVTRAWLDHIAAREPEDAARRAALSPDDADGQRLPEPGDAEVIDSERAGRHVRASVTSEAGALVATDQAALSGWRATVNGEAADVITVDGLFAGVVVGPGEHEVVLTYVSPGRAAGRSVSAAAFLGLLALAVLGRWRAHRPRWTASPSSTSTTAGASASAQKP